MPQLVINFDRVSLSLSEADFNVISNYNMSAPDGSYFYHNDYDCFAHLDVNNNPQWFVFFTKVTLGDNICHEITSIKYILGKSEKLSKEYITLNSEVFNIMLRVLTAIDNKLHYNPRKDFIYKYYIWNKKMKNFDIRFSQHKTDLVQFVDSLEWAFGVDNSD